MLTDPKEIEIISRALQVNVRDPKRSRVHFNNIFSDFFSGIDFSGKRFLDIGAGQFDFGELVRERGGSACGLDNDPAVLELGRYKGFDVIDLDIKNLKSIGDVEPFDGIFNKFSFNAFWFPDDDEHELFIRKLAHLVKPGGWAWLAPWNGFTSDLSVERADVQRILDTQRQVFMQCGFSVSELTLPETKRFGVHGHVENNVLFTRDITRR